MKYVLSLLLAVLVAFPSMARQSKQPLQVQPAFWWSGMKQPSLQIMLHGTGIGASQVSIKGDGVGIDSIFRPDNTNYLFIYINVAQAAPQTFTIELQQKGKVTRVPYELRARDNAVRAQGFTQADVLYLLMPDRFANGDSKNDVVKGLREAVSSQAPDARHGGDIAGMTLGLDYLANLGVTTIWPTPLLINDMPGTSYHGYAITDYYQIDPRYGTNEDYRQFVATAHSKGLKVVQDMVFNHCGSENFLYTDMPDSTWFNHGGHYVQCSYRILSVSDPHGANADLRDAQDGWFVSSMPDFNQRNHHVLNYLIQNSLWWIEYAGIDGIRQDTYPYIDREASARWCKAVMSEYPNFNIVGETWLGNNVGVSFWQKNSPVTGKAVNSELPTVMDFPLRDLFSSALDQQTDDWDNGLARFYNYLSQDAVFADPTHLLTFLANHDTDRFARTGDEAHNRARYRQAIAMLLTLRGIPQLYFGDELAMDGNKSHGDGELRQNFPSGTFASADGTSDSDGVNAFTLTGLSENSRAAYDVTRRLLQWRRGNDVIAHGTMRQFAVRNGVYVYAREYQGHTVTVIVNGTDSPVCLPLAHYAEVLPKKQATDVLTNKTILLDEDTLQLGVRDVLVLDFN